MDITQGCNVTYLYNSGFVVETARNVLIFDICEHSDFVNDVLLSGKKVTVFVTHNHSDHFNPFIYRWASELDVQYVIHRDVESSDGANMLLVDSDEQYSLEDMEIRTYGSTDRGVSFLVDVDELTLFHSGDLNWWKWESDSLEVQRKEEFAYKSEVQKLVDMQIDIAFIPVDPRLGKFHDLAVKYFAESISVNAIIPMHFRDSVAPIENLHKQWRKLSYVSKFVPLIRRGDQVRY